MELGLNPTPGKHKLLWEVNPSAVLTIYPVLTSQACLLVQIIIPAKMLRKLCAETKVFLCSPTLLQLGIFT